MAHASLVADCDPEFHGSRFVLPSAHLYWGYIEGEANQVTSRVKDDRLARLAPTLPLPVSDLHIIWLPAEGGGWIACGIERDELLAIRTREGPTLEWVGPDSVPEAVVARTMGAPVPSSFNLLSGGFEPASSASRRRREARKRLVLVSLIWAGLVFGLSAGAIQRRAQVRQLREREAALIHAAIGDGHGNPHLRLEAALRAQDRTDNGGKATVPFHADASLARLLSRWPDSASAVVDRVSVSGAELMLVALVPDVAASRSLTIALGSPEGWIGPSNQLTAVRGGVRVTLRWQPESIQNAPTSGRFAPQEGEAQ